MRTSKEMDEYFERCARHGEIILEDFENFLGRKLTHKERMEVNALNAELSLEKANKHVYATLGRAFWPLLQKIGFLAGLILIFIGAMGLQPQYSGRRAKTKIAIIIFSYFAPKDYAVSVALLVVGLVLIALTILPFIISMIKQRPDSEITSLSLAKKEDKQYIKR